MSGTIGKPATINSPPLPLAPNDDDYDSNTDSTSSFIDDLLPPLPQSMSFLASDLREGLMHMYGFHHELAAKLFKACIEASRGILADEPEEVPSKGGEGVAPACYGLLAFLHLLVAHCHCPNYNFYGDAYYHYATEEETVFPSVAEGWSNVVEGLRLCGVAEKMNASSATLPVIRALLSSLQILLPPPGASPSIHPHLPKASSLSFADVFASHPENATVRYFYAASLLLLHPWNLYSYPAKEPLHPDTISALSAVLLPTPAPEHSHLGLAHLLVHFTEMSPDPLSSPILYATPQPHLLHMNTHYSLLTGDYLTAHNYNLHAVKYGLRLASAHPDVSGPHSFYVGYALHDAHTLLFSALMGGYKSLSFEAVDLMSQVMTPNQLESAPSNVKAGCEGYFAGLYHALMRFGMWRSAADLEPPPGRDWLATRAAYFCVKAVAHANLAETETAQRHLAKAEEAVKLSEGRYVHNNACLDILAVELLRARGEVSYFAGDVPSGLALLREAVEKEDGLRYDEPPPCHVPCRHSLGALLLEQGRVEEAKEVYMIDLERNPRNPWALAGMVGASGLRRGVGGGCGGCDDARDKGGQGEDSDNDGEEDWDEEKEEEEEACWRAELGAVRGTKEADVEITASCGCAKGGIGGKRNYLDL